MNYHLTISKNIKKYCELRKMSYSELARRSKLHLTTIQVLLYKKDRKDPHISTVHAIAKALKVRIEELLK